MLFLPFGCYTAVLILNRVVSSQTNIDLNIIAGAISVYLLLGVTWAVTYRLMEQWVPGSFELNASNSSEFHQYLYFSFTTLTTLGYGDMVPLKPFARTWAIFESTTGVFYVAVLIARLVSVYRR